MVFARLGALNTFSTSNVFIGIYPHCKSRKTEFATPKYLWHVDCFKLKTIKAQKTLERMLDLAPTCLKNLGRGSISGIVLSL